MITSPETTPVATAEESPETPLSKTRLAIALGLVTFAAFHFWSSTGPGARFSTICLSVAGTVMMNRPLLKQKFTLRDVLVLFSILGILGLCLYLLRSSTPRDFEEEEAELRHYSQAQYVVPAWALFCGLLVFRYRRSQRECKVSE